MLFKFATIFFMYPYHPVPVLARKLGLYFTLTMPQEFEVVRCFSCQTFQIHQTRKDRKFSCKVCGLKQSRRKVYCEGCSKDCRLAVQQLNSHIEKEEEDFLKGITHTDEDQFTDVRDEFDYEQNKDLYAESKQENNCEEALVKPTTSKWTAFLDDDEDYPAEVLSYSFDEHSDSFEIEEDPNAENPTTTFDKFTSVKRFHNSTPKQAVTKRRGDTGKDHLSFGEEDATPVLNERNRCTERNFKFANGENSITPKTKHNFRVAVHEYIRSTQQKNPSLSGDECDENCRKEDAFKKFGQIDDDVLDILNKSFYA